MVKAGRSGLSSSASRSGTRTRKNDSASSNCSLRQHLAVKELDRVFVRRSAGVFVRPMLCQRKFSSRRGSVAAITSLVSAAR